MTVEELIEKLKDCNPKAVLVISNGEGMYEPEDISGNNHENYWNETIFTIPKVSISVAKVIVLE